MESGSYLALPHAVLKSSAYRRLSAHAVKLLCDIGAQFSGYNNGNLSATWRIMQPLGWKSRDTLAKSLRELCTAGFIELTRQGGLNKCCLYALTWRSIDECKGRLDVPATSTPSGLWRRSEFEEQKSPNTVVVSARHGERVNGTLNIDSLTRQAG